MAYGGGFGRSRGGYGDSNGYTNGYAVLDATTVPVPQCTWAESPPFLTPVPSCHSPLAINTYPAPLNNGVTYGTISEMGSISQPP